MPFQSEKQRRYMHANLPDIAKRWERDYAGGGIAELNQELNSLPEYYMPFPAAQGGRIGYGDGLKVYPKLDVSLSEVGVGNGVSKEGRNIVFGGTGMYEKDNVFAGVEGLKIKNKVDFIEDNQTLFKDSTDDEIINFILGYGDPEGTRVQVKTDKDLEKAWLTIKTKFNQGGVVPAHEAGIYGLEDGGNIRFQPHTATDLLVQKTSSGERPKYQPPGHRDAPAPSSRGPREDPDRSGPPPETKTTTPSETTTVDYDDYNYPGIGDDTKTVDRDGKDVYYEDRIIRIAEQEKRTAEQEKKTREVREEASKKGFHQFLLPKATPVKRNWFLRGIDKAVAYVKENPAAALANLFTAGGYEKGSQIFNAIKLAKGIHKFSKTEMGMAITDKLKSGTSGIIEGMNEHNAKIDLYESLPDGHPEKIALQAELEIGKKTPTDVHERDNGQIQETGTSITIDAEEVNDAKTQLLRKYQEMNEASRLAWLRQQQMNRDKQMAYYRMMMKPYFAGAAQGGRVPQGYNTGGLSNLFKLKNV